MAGVWSLARVYGQGLVSCLGGSGRVVRVVQAVWPGSSQLLGVHFSCPVRNGNEIDTQQFTNKPPLLLKR